MDPGQTIEGSGETRPRRCRRPGDRSPSPEGPGPRAFSQHIRRAPVPQCFGLPPTSPNTPGRQTQVFGWKTSGSPAGPAEWMMTISSFNIFPFAWGSMFGHGLNSSRTTASATGQTSRGSSSEISRGHMSTLETPGTSRAASRSPASPCGITSIGSQSGATPFLMSSTQTSSARSSLGQPVSP